MNMEKGDLQENKEVDNVHQDDQARTSDARLENGSKIASHSLANSDINDEVNLEELYVSQSNRYEETSTSDSEAVSKDE